MRKKNQGECQNYQYFTFFTHFFRLLYQNISQESLQTIGTLFKSMVMNIRKDIFSYLSKNY